MGFSSVDALASLGAVDHAAVGLADFGHPVGFLERQASRWHDELESYSTLEGYLGPAIPGLDQVTEWLENNRPSSFTPGISHGDYHLANLMFRYDGPAVAAIVDWEMSTLGDPLLDLGWLIGTWPVAEDDRVGVGGPLGKAGGLPNPTEVIRRYIDRTGGSGF